MTTKPYQNTLFVQRPLLHYPLPQSMERALMALATPISKHFTVRNHCSHIYTTTLCIDWPATHDSPANNIPTKSPENISPTQTSFLQGHANHANNWAPTSKNNWLSVPEVATCEKCQQSRLHPKQSLCQCRRHYWEPEVVSGVCRVISPCPDPPKKSVKRGGMVWRYDPWPNNLLSTPRTRIRHVIDIYLSLWIYSHDFGLSVSFCFGMCAHESIVSMAKAFLGYLPDVGQVSPNDTVGELDWADVYARLVSVNGGCEPRWR